MKVRVSGRARRDLLRIHSFVSQHNEDAANAIIRRINERLEQLAKFPFIGRERSSLGSGIRSLLAGNYLIFYLVDSDRIRIVRVIDGRMDIDEEFRR